MKGARYLVGFTYTTTTVIVVDEGAIYERPAVPALRWAGILRVGEFVSVRINARGEAVCSRLLDFYNSRRGGIGPVRALEAWLDVHRPIRCLELLEM